MLVFLGQLVGPEVPALAAAGAAAAAVPIIIHLLTRLRRRPQAWGAMRFLLEAYRRHRSRLRLEHWLLLLVRCLILIVLGLALSGPGLSGCSPAGAWSGSSRLIYLVVDDSLSSQAAQLEGRTRFDRWRDVAEQLVDSLRPIDRVALWGAAYPATALMGPAMLDHQEVRRQLEQMQPRYSRSNLRQALASIHDALGRQPAGRKDDVLVIVLSDWAQDAMDLRKGPSAELVELGRSSRLLVTRPSMSVGNVQLLAAVPRRYMVLADGDAGASLAVELKLRRFQAGTQPDSVKLRIVALDQDGRALSEPIERRHQWQPGQSIAAMNVELAVAAPSAALSDDRAAVIVASQVRSGGVGDALAADNDQWSVVQIRTQVDVGVLDDLGAPPAEATGISPRQWLRIALWPHRTQSTSAQQVQVVEMDVSKAGEQALAGLDAVMVLRPDLVNQPGWRAIGRLGRRGGLVWLFMPANDAPATWSVALQRELGLNWQLAMEAGSVESARGQGLSLATDMPVPPMLELLAADWQSLLKPLRVSRRFELNVPAGESDVWLALAPAGETEQAGRAQPLMVSTELTGGGRVVLLATALDRRWSNLVTKPMWVPLLHETLRSALARGSAASRLSGVTCGQQPVLAGDWDKAVNLVAIANEGGQRIALRRTDQGLSPLAPLRKPGVYRGDPEAAVPLAVNVDPDAGDTRALDSNALGQWMTALGRWQWLDEEDPAAALAQQASIARLGWPLLWVVLVLVIFETCLARWFSHAGQAQAGSWATRLWRLFKG